MSKQSFITILLSVLMSMTGAKAFAHDIEVENDGVTIYYKWANNNTELAVSCQGWSYNDYSNEYSGNVVIPSSVVYNGNTYSVTSIGYRAFSGCSGLTSVTIPNSVTSIGELAFYDCSGLTSVTIPNSVTSIGDSAFDGCSGLTSVTIPNSVTSIGRYTFYGCSGLTSVTIPNSVTSIGEKAFWGCSGLTSVTIGNSVTSIGSEAFNGCSGLTSVTIPNSVTSIYSGAFYNCSGLTSVTIPNSVTSIGGSAFGNCSGLTSVIIGSGVLSIGSSAFSNTNLKKTIWLTNTPPSGYSDASGAVNYVSNDQFNINNKVVYKYLSSYFDVGGIRYVPVSPSYRTCDAIDCIYSESAENINIGETVTNKGITLTVMKVNPYTCYQNKYIKDVKLSLSGDVGNYAFYGCSLLETAELGQNVTSIGGFAFNSCSQLKSIVIPDAVTSIGSYAFSGCSSMTSAKIGNGVETIDEYTFSGCSSLTEINIGSKVNTINQYAFSGCSALPSITIPQAVTTIGNNVFYNCTSLAKVTIADSESTLTLGSNGSNPIFASCLLDYVYIGRDISYETSSYSGYSPFYRNTSLRAVKITDKETEISENEFYGCTNLQQMEIGDGVTTIGKWAFSGCSSLKYFAFGSQMATIGQDAFSDCTAIEEIISKAQTPPVCGTQALEDINIWECKLYVPDGCMAVYGDADQWKDFLFKEEGEGTLPHGGDDPDDPDNPDGHKKCETPTITVDGSSVKFDCKTSGVIFHYTVKSSDSKSDITNSGIEMKNNYTVSVYASKEGYTDSEVAKKSFQVAGAGKKGDVNGDNKVDVADHVELSKIILEKGQ